MNLTVGNDIGNSETKTIVDDILIKQPSVIKRLIDKPNFTESGDQKNVINLLDDLVVDISSSALKRSGLFFVGKRANLTADGDVENINIDLGGKYKHDIPVVMTLSMVSARAIQMEYQKTNEIPSTLNLNIDMVTAIPASEYSKDKAEQLQKRFLNDYHLVSVYVGNNPVMVKIQFNFVKVTQEGVPALYSFLTSDENLLSDYKGMYIDDDLKPENLRNKKILHVDIGDGTTEYIYTVGLNPVVDACSGERRGVGHATEKAKELLKKEVSEHMEMNRQQFMSILRDPDHNIHEDANHLMRKARVLQSDRISEDVKKKYLNNAAGNVDIIAVYGGGSVQFKRELHDELKEFAEEVKCKLLWIPENYAVDANVNGMMVLMEEVFAKQVEKETK